MFRIVTIASIVVVLMWGRSPACVDPLAAYYTGIVLNNGESVDLDRIERLAESEDAYLKECFTAAAGSGGGEIIIDSIITPAKRRSIEAVGETDSVQLCAYKLRSTYKSDAMVFIGHIPGGLGLYGNVARVIVFFDTTSVPSDKEKAEALATELRRLSSLGIIAISEEVMARAKTAISSQPGQYWSAQDSVLPFNSWFNGDSVDGVNGVYSVRGCGSGVSYELPERSFVAAAVVAGAGRHTDSAPFRADVTVSGIRFSFPTINGVAAHLAVTDMGGRRIASVPLVKNAASFTLNKSHPSVSPLAPGCYMASLVDARHPIRSCVFTIAGY